MKRQVMTVAEHRELAKRIRYLELMRHALINDYHTKKGTFKRRKYIFKDGTVAKFYTKHLFLKQKWLTGFGTFPCEFQGSMDSVLFLHHSEDYTTDELVDVYYNTQVKVPTQDLFSYEQKITEFDYTVVRNLNKDLLSIMEKCFDETKHWFPNRNVSKMKAYITKVKGLVQCNDSI